jgi:hypothetical protein
VRIGLAQVRQGWEAIRASEVEIYRSYAGLVADVYGEVGRVEEGLAVLAEALAFIQGSGERVHEAELYRLKGELTLRKLQVRSPKPKVQGQEGNQKAKIPSAQRLASNTQAETEECFLKAIETARQQQAKSWDLRATMSLARLWQQRGKTAEARQMLAGVYGWFTEGFDTADLKEAKALLEELGR